MKKWIYVILGGVLFVTIAVYADNRLSYGEVCSVDGKCSTQTTNTYTASSHRMPEDVYQALLNLNDLKEKQKNLQSRGFELDPDEKELLNKYIKLTKGVMIIKFMRPKCGPCIDMTTDMESDANGPSFFTYLSDKKVHFYEINKQEDEVRPTSLSNKFGVSVTPLLFILKDGQGVAYLRGYQKGSPALQGIKQKVDQLLK